MPKLNRTIFAHAESTPERTHMSMWIVRMDIVSDALLLLQAPAMGECLTCLMLCPSCGNEYIDYAELKDDPDRLCAPCFEEWDGLTLEEIMGSSDSAGDANET